MQSGLPRSLRGLNDSKQLTPLEREIFFGVLTNLPHVLHSVVGVDAAQVDSINILRATHCAMNEALDRLQPEPTHVLVDGTWVGSMRFPQTPLVKGDERSYSIAAASVIAKVTRDRMMVAYHEEWPAYGFAEHKGYGTPQHLAALAEHGPCPIHRRSFAPIRPMELELFGSEPIHGGAGESL
jgi:ribonuclease HII